MHARGSGAHGYFECYKPLAKFTRAALFAEVGKVTPVFVRFSTVAGERGSVDTARDVRGFAVKFYTDEGNFDLVGNNIPVFFIQDAMKFPDLVHAVKPEPHHGMPQAASAHDTFWDFVSLMPESTHMLMWVMSDRAIPRSLRMMQGFGVHTFRLVNAEGESSFVKFHWKPMLGTHSLVWDEAVKIPGADPDFHRRDLWEAIESGEYPEWELGLQIFTEDAGRRTSASTCSTRPRSCPKSWCRCCRSAAWCSIAIPDNFFAETEQVAFCAAHVVPGIDFSNDPLLAGRIHSYVDTQITRLGGPNFHEIPDQRADRTGAQQPARRHASPGDPSRPRRLRAELAGRRLSVPGGRSERLRVVPAAACEKTRCAASPRSSPTTTRRRRCSTRARPTSSRRTSSRAFRFELSKVTVPAIRERMVASLRNVSARAGARGGRGSGHGGARAAAEGARQTRDSRKSPCRPRCR